MRLLAAESGAHVEFRLQPWSAAMAAFDRGEIDVMSLARSDLRAPRYDYLAQTWTLHRGLLIHTTTPREIHSLSDLHGEVVACEERGQVHETLLALPPDKRPEIRPVASHREACRLLKLGEVTVAAGNLLTLRYFAQELGLSGLGEVALEPYGYFLAVRKGRAAEFANLKLALEKVRYTNQFHALIEHALLLPERPRSWLDYGRYFAALVFGMGALAAATLAWNRALTQKVERSTHELEGTIREKHRLATALVESEARFRGMIDTLNVGVVQCGANGQVLFANPAAVTMLGIAAPELRKRSWSNLVATALGDDGTPVAAPDEPVQKALATGVPVRDAVLGVERSGSERVWLLASAEPSRGTDGAVREVIVTFSDISERKRTQEQIRHLAYHDSLTGLPNRELFLDRLTMAVAHATRHKIGLAVAFVDLDQFKVINDSLGHSVGDQLLKAIGQRVRSALRQEDTVARLGGDEFTALLMNVSEAANVLHVADKLQHAIKQPLQFEGRELSVSASIGIALFPADGENAESLLKNADTAMYRAKELGRDQCQFYAADMSQRVMLHLDLDARLRKALQAGGLRLHYQPFVNLESGEVEGVEALLRWQDAERGMIPPDQFIPVAEVTGLISELSAWVLRTGCAEHPGIARAFPGRPLLAVNLSARMFHRGEVLAQVQAILKETGLPPSLLELEITESVAMQDHARTVETMHQLRALGLRLSIDDFGTGYSSLSYLRRFPVDTLKVDRSFVKDVATDKTAAGVVGAIISVAHELGLRVVAEGVETEEQLERLRLLRCDAAQGYLLGRPVPVDELTASLEKVAQLWSNLKRGPAPAATRS